MYNLIINYIHNLEVSKTPYEVGHNSRPNKNSRVHSGFKQTNKQCLPKKLPLQLSLYSIQESQTLMPALQIVPTAKKHNFSLCMSPISNVLPLRF